MLLAAAALQKWNRKTIKVRNLKTGSAPREVSETRGLFLPLWTRERPEPILAQWFTRARSSSEQPQTSEGAGTQQKEVSLRPHKMQQLILCSRRTRGTAESQDRVYKVRPAAYGLICNDSLNVLETQTEISPEMTDAQVSLKSSIF